MESEIIMPDYLQQGFIKKPVARLVANGSRRQITSRIINSFALLHDYTFQKTEENPNMPDLENNIEYSSVKPAMLQKDTCTKCGGMMTESSICRECRNVLHLVCVSCDDKIWTDIHEWCYCQMELLTSPIIF